MLPLFTFLQRRYFRLLVYGFHQWVNDDNNCQQSLPCLDFTVKDLTLANSGLLPYSMIPNSLRHLRPISNITIMHEIRQWRVCLTRSEVRSDVKGVNDCVGAEGSVWGLPVLSILAVKLKYTCFSTACRSTLHAIQPRLPQAVKSVQPTGADYPTQASKYCVGGYCSRFLYCRFKWSCP